MMSKILNALAQLDPDVDEHWTNDGLPRLDVLIEISGDKDLTRAQVTQARPGFSRKLAKLGTENGTSAVETASAQSETDTSSRAAQAPEKPSTTEVPLEKEDVPVSDKENARSLLEKELEEGRKRLSELEANLDKAQKALDEQRAKVDNVIDKLTEMVFEKPAHAVQSYLEQQRRILADRAAQMQALRESNINLNELGRRLRAPIDAAMARKTALGTDRPKG